MVERGHPKKLKTIEQNNGIYSGFVWPDVGRWEQKLEKGERLAVRIVFEEGVEGDHHGLFGFEPGERALDAMESTFYRNLVEELKIEIAPLEETNRRLSLALSHEQTALAKLVHRFGKPENVRCPRRKRGTFAGRRNQCELFENHRGSCLFPSRSKRAPVRKAPF